MQQIPRALLMRLQGAGEDARRNTRSTTKELERENFVFISPVQSDFRLRFSVAPENLEEAQDNAQGSEWIVRMEVKELVQNMPPISASKAFVQESKQTQEICWFPSFSQSPYIWRTGWTPCVRSFHWSMSLSDEPFFQTKTHEEFLAKKMPWLNLFRERRTALTQHVFTQHDAWIHNASGNKDKLGLVQCWMQTSRSSEFMTCICCEGCNKKLSTVHQIGSIILYAVPCRSWGHYPLQLRMIFYGKSCCCRESIHKVASTEWISSSEDKIQRGLLFHWELLVRQSICNRLLTPDEWREAHELITETKNRCPEQCIHALLKSSPGSSISILFEPLRDSYSSSSSSSSSSLSLSSSMDCSK